MSSISDFCLLFVKDAERGTALKPTCNCRVNDKIYDPSNATKEDDIYIPLDWLKEGCVLTIDSEERSLFLRMKHYWQKWYIDIWNIPYNSDVSKIDRRELFSQKEAESFVMM